MESSLSVPLAEQLEAFQHIMEQSGKESQMEDIDRLIACVKSIQADLEDTMDEVSYLLEQLQSMKDSSMKVNLGRMQEDMRESLLQVGNQINTVEKAAAEGIQNTIYSLKEKGIQALNQILDIAHVYQGLSRAEALLMQAVDGMERKLEDVDRMAEEFHAIKGHAKNLGRAAFGRSAEEIAARDQTKGILAKIRAGMEYCKKVLEGMGQEVLMARAHVVHLKLSAERKTGKVSSVQEIAGELRDTSVMDFGRQLEPAQAR